MKKQHGPKPTPFCEDKEMERKRKRHKPIRFWSKSTGSGSELGGGLGADGSDESGVCQRFRPRIEEPDEAQRKSSGRGVVPPLKGEIDAEEEGVEPL